MYHQLPATNDSKQNDQHTIGSEATSNMMGSLCEVRLKHETTLSIQLVWVKWEGIKGLGSSLMKEKKLT